MNSLAPLFAAGVDIGEIVKVAVLLLLLIIPAIGQLLAKIRQIPPPAGRPLPPAPVPKAVADEIEEFMRLAAQGRPAEGARKVRPQQLPAAEPVRAEVVAQEQPVGGQVGKHVEKYLDAQNFTRRGESLGAEVGQEVAKDIDQHLQQVFDHRVSKLEAVPGEAAVPPVAYEPPDLVGASGDIPDSFATGLLELITNPDSIRQAIILSEILHRPEERWA